VSSGNRFHPIEILISIGIKTVSVLLIGPLPVAVIMFEVILNSMAQFTHSNVRLPQALDRVLRWFLITPDVHRVHHSIHLKEMNSNYGFNISLWDRIFGTFIEQPKEGHQDMLIGLKEMRDEKDLAACRTWVPMWEFFP